MREAFKRQWPWLAVSLAVMLADQLTKAVALVSLSLYEPREILPVFNFTLAYNQGAAFSFLADSGGWQRWLFAGLALLASIVIVVWLLRLKPAEKWQSAALALILGGAVGNLIDRLLHGFVVDFLDFHWGLHHFPAFNLADTAITLGAIVIALDMLKGTDESHA